MILYFSATGNSEYVAKYIASKTKDEAISIFDYDKTIKQETLGIITPTYAWGLPIIVSEYLKGLSCDSNPIYVYFIATYGTTPGQTGRFVEDILKCKGININAKYSIKMPDTWTPIFDLSDKEKVKHKNDNADIKIEKIIKQINNQQIGDFMENKMPYHLSKIVHNTMYETMRQTKNFRVEDTCIGCGLCARNCPVSAIEIKNHKPQWTKDKCAMCLSCLHHCPKFSIQYGKNTKRHGQYVHEKMV